MTYDIAVELIAAGQHHRALISLCVAARRFATLNDWEQACAGAEGDAAQKARTIQFRDCLDRDSPLPANANVFDPLALLVALDEFLFENEWGQHLHRAAPLELGGNSYWLTKAPLATRPSGSLARQAANLTRWLKHHTVIPVRVDDQFDIVLSRTHSHADRVLLKIATTPEPHVEAFIAHFDDGADVKWSRDPTGGNWTTLHIEPADARAASIQSQLARALQDKATFWLAPEFTLDPALRQVCRDTLEAEPAHELAFVVPASFHEAINGKKWNIAPVWDGAGTELFEHRKLKLFGDEEHGAEAISLGSTLRVLDTPIGLVAACICKDFMDIAGGMAALRDAIPVDWWLVVSYGDASTHRAHLATAKSIAKLHPGAHCLVAHTLNTALPDDRARGKDGPLPGFVVTPSADVQNVAKHGSQFAIPLIFKAKASPTTPGSRASRLKVAK